MYEGKKKFMGKLFRKFWKNFWGKFPPFSGVPGIVKKNFWKKNQKKFGGMKYVLYLCTVKL
jgi:hypothetical protein